MSREEVVEDGGGGVEVGAVVGLALGLFCGHVLGGLGFGFSARDINHRDDALYRI